METKGIHFMYEHFPIKKEIVKEKDFKKIHFLKKFVVSSGRSSLRRKGNSIKIPIQSVIKETVGDFDYSILDSLKPEVSKSLPLLLKRKEKKPKEKYNPVKNVISKKYGILDPLIVDKRVKVIKCVNNKIYVNFEDNDNIFSGLEFKNSNSVNKVIKKFSKVLNVKLSEDNPIINSTLPEGFKVTANYGTKYVSPSFILVRS